MRRGDETCEKDESTNAAAAAERMDAMLVVVALGKKGNRACEIAADAEVASAASSTIRANGQSFGDVVALEEEAGEWTRKREGSKLGVSPIGPSRKTDENRIRGKLTS